MSLQRILGRTRPHCVRNPRVRSHEQAHRPPGCGRLAGLRRVRLGVALVACAAFLAPLLASPASAFANVFPIEETFENSTLGPTWRIGGSAELTAKTEAEDGTGWLRLTKAENNEFGYVFDNEAFPSTEGALVEYEYADYGGTGADGMSFFLFNGSVNESEFHAGDSGGSLGYASCPTEEKEGLNKGYIGVGFDEYGNFTNLGSICGLDGTTQHPNYVTVRGSEEENYKMIEGASVATTQSLKANRSEARHVTITVTPEDKLDVYIRYPNGYVQTVVEEFQLPKEHEPATLKFGYVGSTGGSTDYHEVRSIKAAKPTEIVSKVEKTNAATGREEELAWTATVENEGPNSSSGEKITTSTDGQTLTGVTWTCEATGGATCPATEGSGMINSEAGAMPIGAKLIYKLKGTAPKSTSYAQMTLGSEPTGEDGEMNPAYETATATTELMPEFTSSPTFTLSSGGLAQATPGVADGGPGVTYAYHWQRCAPTGGECADITGAEALEYQTTEADREHTIRFAQTATDEAGSVSAYTSAYEPLPTATITEEPAEYSSGTSATFAFTSTTSEAVFECRLDGSAWQACTSPATYSGLANGEHSFGVRAVYGGLSNASAATYEWTVESTVPPKLTFTEEPAEYSASTSGTFGFGEVVVGATIECSVDGGPFVECANPAEFSGLVNGEHTLEARQQSRAGLTSEAIKYAWTVESTVPPKLTFTEEPAEYSALTSGTFGFGEVVVGASIECSVDGGPFVECANPAEFSGLADGRHTLLARQRTRSGLTSEAIRYVWTVETTRPPKPSIIGEPAEHSSTGSPQFEFGNLDGADTLECRLAGQAWQVCSATQSFSGLSEGAYEISVRQSSEAGLHSEEATYAWYVETAAPAAATPVSAPEAETSATSAHFEFSHAPGAAVECSIDGGPYVPCTSGLTVGKLSEGLHTISFRQVSLAGVASAPITYRWHVAKHASKKAARAAEGPITLTGMLGSRATARGDRSVMVGCKLSGGNLRLCTVIAYHRMHKHRVEVGRGTVRLGGRHGSSGVVKVRLNARGRRLLESRLGGLAVRMKVRAKAYGARKQLKAKSLKVRLYAQRVLVIPIAWPFETESSQLKGHAERIVRGAAREIEGARKVTCIGYTDSRGGWKYNMALGLRRAKSVCKALRHLGVHAHFKAASQGEGEPRATNETAAGRARNRRVEIRVSYGRPRKRHGGGAHQHTRRHGHRRRGGGHHRAGRARR